MVLMVTRTITLPTLRCTRCCWSWFPRRLAPPKVCPKCKRTDWNVARVKK